MPGQAVPPFKSAKEALMLFTLRSIWSIRTRTGTGPEIIAGHAPNGPNQIALGTATLNELNKTIGDTVHGEGPDGTHDYRIVGRAVFPRLDSPQPLANGAAQPAITCPLRSGFQIWESPSPMPGSPPG